MPFQMCFNPQECVACGTCAVACMDQYDTVIGRDVPCRRIVTLEEHTNGTPVIRYLSISCMHCRNPICQKVCSQDCYTVDPETALVLLDPKNCIGCGACVKACPIEAVALDTAGKASKCNGCRERLLLGLPAACERACQNQAIRFKPTEDGAGDNRETVALLAQLLREQRNGRTEC